MVASWIMWATGGGLGVAGLVVVALALRRRSGPDRACPGCRYDLAGVPGLTCPECGREAGSEAELLRRPRRSPRVAVGLALLLLASGLALHGEARRRPNGWWSLLPRAVVVLGYWASGANGAATELAAGGLSPFVSTTGSSAPGWARWELRLAADRSVREVFASRAQPMTAPTPAWSRHFTIMAHVLRDKEVATDVAIGMLRSPDRAQWEIGVFVAARPGMPRGSWPHDPRFIGSLETMASDASSRHRNAAHLVLARIEPLPVASLERSTRACAGHPSSFGWRSRWADDITAVTFAAKERAVPWLTMLLDDPDACVRVEAADGLRRIGGPSEPALPRLREMRSDPDEDVREIATAAITRIERLVDLNGGTSE